MSLWGVRTIGDLADATKNALVGGPFGSNLVGRDYTTTGVPVIRGQNMGNGRWVSGEFAFVSASKADALAANKARPGDLVFTQRGTLGQVALVPKHPWAEYVISQSQMKLSADSRCVDPLFLYYVFSSEGMQEYIRQHAIQTGVPHTNLGILRATPINLPPLREQQAVATILGALDDKIEANERMNATLDAMARALFRSWFVDFDPVRAKANGRAPAHMDASTAALFPDAFEDSSMGPIPAGWRVASVADVAEVNSWTLSARDELDQIDYIEISEVLRGNIQHIERYSRGAEPSRARRRLRHGDTVLSTVRPDRGAYFLSLNPPETLVASTGFAVLSPKAAPWSLIHAAMTQPDVSERLGLLADGAAYPSVRPEIAGATPLVLSDRELESRFHDVAAPLYELAETNRRESRTLSELRDTLLPKLISGELRVSDAAREVEAVDHI